MNMNLEKEFSKNVNENNFIDENRTMLTKMAKDMKFVSYFYFTVGCLSCFILLLALILGESGSSIYLFIMTIVYVSIVFLVITPLLKSVSYFSNALKNEQIDKSDIVLALTEHGKYYSRSKTLVIIYLGLIVFCLFMVFLMA